jgi:hypothetical protein
MSTTIETRCLQQSNEPHLFVGAVGETEYILVDKHDARILIWDTIWAALAEQAAIEAALHTALETKEPPYCE